MIWSLFEHKFVTGVFWFGQGGHTHRQTDRQTNTNPLGHARSYIVNVAMFFGVLGGASKRYNSEFC